jgi:hypothetical protein
MVNHAAEAQFRNPLDHVAHDVSDFARTLSGNISRELAQNPEQSLSLMRAINGSNDLPKGFANADDLFGNVEERLFGNGNRGKHNGTDHGGLTKHGTGFEDLMKGPRILEPQITTHDGPGKGQRLAHFAEMIAGGFSRNLDGGKPQQDGGKSEGGGGSVWKTIGSVAAKVLPFFL